jgi:hypothetical protein
VIRLVLLTFLRAPVANFSAEAAELHGELRTAAHQRHTQFADCGTINADTRAIRPIFADASISAMVAFHRACLAGFDTVTMLFMMVRHIFLRPHG